MSPRLRFIQAFIRAQACKGDIRFRDHRDINTDGEWSEQTVACYQLLANEIINRNLPVSDAGIIWLANYLASTQAIGTTTEALLAVCDPKPEPEPQPRPDPFEPTPVPSGDSQVLTIVNLSDGQLSQRELQVWVDANQAQIDEHAADDYGHMTLRLARNSSDVHHGEWTHEVRSVSHIGGAGGAHTVNEDWEPIAWTFLDSGLDPRIVFSHENLEVLANAFVSLWMPVGQRLWWYEICDPVQRISYEVRGVPVSDFVLRGWWGDYGERPEDYHAAAKFAGQRYLTSPAQIAPGGYMGSWDPITKNIEFVAAAGGPGLASIGQSMAMGCQLRALYRNLPT